MKELQANDPDKASAFNKQRTFLYSIRELSLVANIDPQLGTQRGCTLGAIW